MPNSPLIIDTKMLKTMAINKLETEKPLMKWVAINTIIPLITRRNRPSVTIVTGSVRIIRIGFTIILSNARMMATINAV